MEIVKLVSELAMMYGVGALLAWLFLVPLKITIPDDREEGLDELDDWLEAGIQNRIADPERRTPHNDGR